MRRILEDRLMRYLKEVGYEAVERKALEVYMASLEAYMLEHLKGVVSVSRHGLKSHSTLLDVLWFIEGKKLELPPFERIEYEEEEVVREEKFVSPLSSSIEKYIHIYDFMPSFPPTHAFRQTIVKGGSKGSKSMNVKNRLEQSLRTEGNLLKLIRASGSLPPFVNFLYKNE
ncbi:putative transcription factor IID complex subunit [Encephalitozoon hellem]|uniref:Transcription factor TFIID complex subunit 8 n=1 Tax=Encephalitozoon hellem TaxID=27973 RepID=A0A9Q9FCP4_ENCHE|nr:uncharacterized protein EHEL_111130 [Encephalitozoon hellem ATCC 50504]AFM99387.1 hypothetical protein EHEL_111130 [Encephalitozoon hellem ATCC 50504]KAG5859032.1 putative transcription factor IID complex subunit [Encephalitozoon hellem]UTX44395.1 transcription factor TFIID complex subunit 8 [Encephalitozoon hellem]|eukprot:XP_003888368.1 hypothetical protein EHEL_111130 [Encephalitozoon hellem ATCC 50504]